MNSRQYAFNNSRLTVKFGNILDSEAEVIVSSDDCNVTMERGMSDAIRSSMKHKVFISYFRPETINIDSRIK